MRNQIYFAVTLILLSSMHPSFADDEKKITQIPDPISFAAGESIKPQTEREANLMAAVGVLAVSSFGLAMKYKTGKPLVQSSLFGTSAVGIAGGFGILIPAINYHLDPSRHPISEDDFKAEMRKLPAYKGMVKHLDKDHAEDLLSRIYGEQKIEVIVKNALLEDTAAERKFKSELLAAMKKERAVLEKEFAGMGSATQAAINFELARRFALVQIFELGNMTEEQREKFRDQIEADSESQLLKWKTYLFGREDLEALPPLPPGEPLRNAKEATPAAHQ